MSPELFWTVVVAGMTALMWTPHILALIAENGLRRALMDGGHDILNPESATRLSAEWARRAQRAHVNAVENLAVFAALAVATHLAGVGDATTAAACAVFAAARAGHFAVYALGLPVIRTVLFLVGVGCQLVLAATVLGAI